jgi:hypothetical protein
MEYSSEHFGDLAETSLMTGSTFRDKLARNSAVIFRDWFVVEIVSGTVSGDQQPSKIVLVCLTYLLIYLLNYLLIYLLNYLFTYLITYLFTYLIT